MYGFSPTGQTFDGVKISLNKLLAYNDILTLRKLCTQPLRFCIGVGWRISPDVSVAKFLLFAHYCHPRASLAWVGVLALRGWGVLLRDTPPHRDARDI